MSENKIAQSQRNGKFNRYVSMAVAAGFTVEVEITEHSYGESAYAIIKRHTGEVNNFYDVMKAAEVIHLISSYSTTSKRSSMLAHRSSLTESMVKLPVGRIISWLSVWASKEISDIVKAA